MLRAALTAIPGTPASAVCVAPQPLADLPPFVEAYVSGHPVPDESSVRAGTRALDQATRTSAGDLFLVLLSGGASALMAAPAPGVSLADKQEATGRLLRAGADIHALNAVRKHLSRAKGGRLAAAAAATTVCLAVSDVVGDDTAVIGSGPAVADPSTFADALGVLDRFGGRGAYPAAVAGWLARGATTGTGESPKPGDARLARARTHVIASRTEAMRGAAAEAERRGFNVVVYGPPVVGEARDAALAHVARAAEAARRAPARLCFVSAGETTVTVRGRGRGGRNQEFVLACVPALATWRRPAVVVSQGTDGIDGPTDAAGAVADGTTLARADRAGLQPPAAFLAENDAYRFFAALGDLVMTGPTGTNVGDVQVIVVGEERT
jgi:hydroxypyruvate reductase